jgi:hypothetical protein
MKWAAAIIVVLSFFYGVNRGWHDPHRDVIFYPLSGFIVGLIVFWLLRVALRLIHKQSDDDGVGTVLYWVSSAIALYYVAFAAFAISGDYGGLPGYLIAIAVICWAIGWAIRRAFARVRSN